MCKIKRIIFEDKIKNEDEELILNLSKIIQTLFDFTEEYFVKTHLSSKLITSIKIENNDDLDAISEDIIFYNDSNDIVLKTTHELFDKPLTKNFPSLTENDKILSLNQDKKGKFFIPSLILIKRNKIEYSLKISKYELIEFNLKDQTSSFVRFAKNKQDKMYLIDLLDTSYILNLIEKIKQELEI